MLTYHIRKNLCTLSAQKVKFAVTISTQIFRAIKCENFCAEKFSRTCRKTSKIWYYVKTRKKLARIEYLGGRYMDHKSQITNDSYTPENQTHLLKERNKH